MFWLMSIPHFDPLPKDGHLQTCNQQNAVIFEVWRTTAKIMKLDLITKIFVILVVNIGLYCCCWLDTLELDCLFFWNLTKRFNHFSSQEELYVVVFKQLLNVVDVKLSGILGIGTYNPSLAESCRGVVSRIFRGQCLNMQVSSKQICVIDVHAIRKKQWRWHHLNVMPCM